MTAIGAAVAGTDVDIAIGEVRLNGDNVGGVRLLNMFQPSSSSWNKIPSGVFGEVDSTGSTNKGTGFSASVTSNVYTIAFTDDLPVAPVVLASCIDGGNYIHKIFNVTASGFDIQWVDRGTSSALATDFSFFAGVIKPFLHQFTNAWRTALDFFPSSPS